MRRSSSKGGLRLERKNAVGGGKKGSSRRVSSYVETLKTPKGFSIHLHGGCNLYKLKCDSRWRNRGRRTFYSASFIRATHKRRFRRFFHPMKLLCGACRRLCARIVGERERERGGKKKKRKRDKIPLPDNFGWNTTIRDSNLWINYLFFFFFRKLNFPPIETKKSRRAENYEFFNFVKLSSYRSISIETIIQRLYRLVLLLRVIFTSDDGWFETRVDENLKEL